jgi:hypothetical protein
MSKFVDWRVIISVETSVAGEDAFGKVLLRR